MTGPYTDVQLDALRELANIGSGTAGTALSQLLGGRPVDISVPRALALPLADAVEAVGAAEAPVVGVAIPLHGSFDGVVLLIFSEADAAIVCGMLGVDAETDVGRSALAEVGNILGTSYVRSLGQITGFELLPSPPQIVSDMLAAIVATVLAERAGETDLALVLDSELTVEGEPCSLSFLLLPELGGVGELLSRLGL